MAHIMIIDDSVSALEAMRETIAAEGHSTTTFSNVPRNLPEILAAGVDLIITDIFMPDRDGLEVLRELRARRLNIPVIAVSGKGAEFGVLHVARLLGAKAILAKPFSADTLLKGVRSVLQ